MKIKWIVAADRIQARIFKAKPFTLITTLKNSLGREKNKAMRTDKPGWGRAQYSGSAGIHAMSGEKSPHEEAAVQFARMLAHFLERQSEAHRYDQIVIAAEAKMMGRIRSVMAPHLSKNVEWIKKDFGHLTDFQIGKSFAIPGSPL